MKRNRITQAFLFSLGFRITSASPSWVDYEKDGLIVSTGMGINGGGFNINLVGINYEDELLDVIETGEIKEIPVDMVYEFSEIFKNATGKQLKF